MQCGGFGEVRAEKVIETAHETLDADTADKFLKRLIAGISPVAGKKLEKLIYERRTK
jgi:hypothetical protein